MFTAPTAVGKDAVLVCVFVQGLWRGHPEGHQVKQVVTGGEMALITLCSPRVVVADVGCVIEEGQLLGYQRSPRVCCWTLVVPKLDDMVPAVPHRSSG